MYLHPKFYRMDARRLILCLPLLTIGCSKSNTPSPTNGTLSATAGTSNFNAAQVEGLYSQSFGLMAVLGYSIQSNDTTSFLLQFAYIPPVGLAISSDTTQTALNYTIPGKRYDAFLGDGKVVLTLTSADTVGHKLAGTFNGTVYNDANPMDSVVVTNGKFSSTYSVSP